MTTYSFHRNTLEEEARHILEECRVVVPGIQTLIGFQMIAVFSGPFYEKLAPNLRLFHLGAMSLVLVAMFLLLTPAAYHRLAEPGVVSTMFVKASTRMLCWAMAFLRLGLVAEVYVVTRALELPPALCAGISGLLFLLSWGLWSIYPRISILRLAPCIKFD